MMKLAEVVLAGAAAVGQLLFWADTSGWRGQQLLGTWERTGGTWPEVPWPEEWGGGRRPELFWPREQGFLLRPVSFFFGILGQKMVVGSWPECGVVGVTWVEAPQAAEGGGWWPELPFGRSVQECSFRPVFGGTLLARFWS